MSVNLFKTKIPVQCVDNASGLQAVVVYEDRTYPLNHEGGTTGYSIATGPGSTHNSSVKVFHRARCEDVKPSNTNTIHNSQV